MNNGLKIVLIGAASREFARSVVHDLVLERQLHESRDLDVHLVDIDRAGLELMHGYARRCAEAAGARVSFHATTERERALEGADFVLVAVAVKRMELWEQDFRVPYYEGVALFSALQRQGVPSRFVIYPDEGHWILKPQNSLHWYGEFLGWLERHLGRPIPKPE